MIVEMLGWILRPTLQWPVLEGLFPGPSSMQSHIDDPVLDRFLVPLGGALQRLAMWFRGFQQGVTQHYVFYILVTTMVMLSTLIPVERVLALLATR
jgi:hypothetical protein